MLYEHKKAPHRVKRSDKFNYFDYTTERRGGQ